MVEILKATRPFNLLLLFLTQILTSYFLGFGNTLADVFDKIHIALYITTILSCAFGYLYNDFMDYKADALNRPDSNFSANPERRKSLLIFSIFCALVSIVYGFATVYRLGVFIALVISLLFFYNVLLKRLPIIGNLLVAVLGAFSILILVAFDANINQELVLIFSINAFGMHFLREMIKDTEDMEGDEVAGYKTFPLLAGLKTTRIFLIVSLFLYIMVFTTCVRLMMMRYFSAPLSYTFLAYNVLCIGLPLFHLLSKLQLATDKNDFNYMSKVALYIMVTGTLSMLFF